ncbi:hypothetical protein ABZW50_11535 [Streptomyces bacillaris]
MNAEQLRGVVTDTELSPYARLIWVHLNTAAEPQNSNSLVDELGFSRATVSRSVGALRGLGLIRRHNGVWRPETGR